jgi:transcription initiation factor TFIIA small subunit
MSSSSVYQIYRSTTIGIALDNTLRELTNRQILTPRVVQYILGVFDQIINQKLTSLSVKEKPEFCFFFKGHRLSYRACDQAWTLLFDSLTFTSKTDPLWKMTLIGQNKKIKIIACPATKLSSPNTEQSTTNEDHHEIKSKRLKKFKSA